MKKLISVLQPAKERDKFYCPNCNGHNFSINKVTGAYSCYSGCSSQAIYAAAKEKYPELFKQEERTEKAPRKPEITEYIYTDRENNPLIKVKKVVLNEDGKKQIKQLHWAGSLWNFGYGSIKTSEIPLYRYSEIMTAIKQGETIVLCEGESTADAFWSKGIPATTTIGGTGKTVVKKKGEDTEGKSITVFERNLKTFESIKPALADLGEAEIILAPDQDKPGCLHMEMMAEILNVKGWLYVFPDSFQWSRLKDKGGIDFVDWVHDYPKLTKEDVFKSVVPKPTHGSISSDPKQQQSQSSPTVTITKRPKAAVIAKKLHQAHPNLLYVADRKVWMLYESSTKGAWNEIPEELVERLVMQLLEELGYGELDSFAPVSNTIKFLRTRTPAFLKSWEEADSNLLPFTNGVLDLRKGDFLEHHPKYHFTWTLPRPHDPTADGWHKIDAWLDFVTQGKSGLRSILECYAAAVLKGRADLQKFLHLMGIGGSGKGTYMKLLSSLIGTNNVVTSNLEQFCINNFEAARIHRKRLVLFSDERNKPRSISEFMKLTGQDMLRAERKQKDAFNFTYEGMVVLASEAPIFYGEMGYGLKRRTILMPMNARIEDKDRRDLQLDFEPELAAFTNHLLSLPDEFVSETLKNTQETPDIKAYYWKARLREDSIAAWIDERVVYDAESETSYMSLYENYRNYCQESGNQTKSKNKFSDELPEVCELLQWKFYKHKTAYGRVVKGLRVRKVGEHSDYPGQANAPCTSPDDAKMTTLVTTCDDLDDDLKSDSIKEVTTMTTFDNSFSKNEKIEESKCKNQENLVSQDTSVPRRESSTFTDVIDELNDSWLASRTKPSSVKEADFIAKFSNLKAVEIHLQKLEKAKKIVRSRGRIYNAVKSIPAVGDVIVFKTQEGEEKSGEVKRIDYPHFYVDVYGKMAYVHIEVIQKR